MRLHIRDEQRCTGKVSCNVGNSAKARRFPGLGKGCGRLFELLTALGGRRE